MDRTELNLFRFGSVSVLLKSGPTGPNRTDRTEPPRLNRSTPNRTDYILNTYIYIIGFNLYRRFVLCVIYTVHIKPYYYPLCLRASHSRSHSSQMAGELIPYSPSLTLRSLSPLSPWPKADLHRICRTKQRLTQKPQTLLCSLSQISLSVPVCSLHMEGLQPTDLIQFWAPSISSILLSSVFAQRFYFSAFSFLGWANGALIFMLGLDMEFFEIFFPSILQFKMSPLLAVGNFLKFFFPRSPLLVT